MMNAGCQIRNKTSIHEALASLCEDEILDGDNQVLCNRCKVKTNIMLQTDMLDLSLERFDLDYTIFETVRLNLLLHLTFLSSLPHTIQLPRRHPTVQRYYLNVLPNCRLVNCV